MERTTNRVLYKKNSTEKKYMASTTKILTAITAIENLDLNKSITIQNTAVGIEGSSIYLVEGEELTVKELLYGLMLRSGNDCAVALALATSGSIEQFSNLMNKTAEKIGAKDSNFVNPHGLHDDNHYTTAYDLALISCYAMGNNDFREIVSTKKITISNTTKDYKRVLFNKNKMLSNFEGANGIKTGYTKKAGRCLVTSAIQNGMELISVVLNCGPMWEVSSNILNECFSSYHMQNVLNSNNIVDFYKINDKKIPIISKEDVYLPLSKLEGRSYTTEIIYNLDNFDENYNNSVGEINFYASNNLIFSQKLYTINCINDLWWKNAN